MDIIIQLETLFTVEFSYISDVLLLLIYKAYLKSAPIQNRLQGNLGVYIIYI